MRPQKFTTSCFICKLERENEGMGDRLKALREKSAKRRELLAQQVKAQIFDEKFANFV